MSGGTTEEQQEAAFLSRMEQLREAIETAAPGYSSLLETIHKQLALNENLLHILSNEQVGIIIAGLSKRKNIVIAETAKKQASSSGGKKVPKDIDSYM